MVPYQGQPRTHAEEQTQLRFFFFTLAFILFLKHGIMLHFRGSSIFIKSPWAILRLMDTTKTAPEGHEMRLLKDLESKYRHDTIEKRDKGRNTRRSDAHHTCVVYAPAIDYTKSNKIWRSYWI